MSDATHTPGPLRYEPSPGEPNLGRIVNSERNRWVAIIQHNGEAMPERQHADGHLWAAASDQHKALLLAQRLIREALPKFNWGASALDANAIKLLNEAPAVIDAAIAKAKGGAS